MGQDAVYQVLQGARVVMLNVEYAGLGQGEEVR
jgi:hypothetical protein